MAESSQERIDELLNMAEAEAKKPNREEVCWTVDPELLDAAVLASLTKAVHPARLKVAYQGEDHMVARIHVRWSAKSNLPRCSIA